MRAKTGDSGWILSARQFEQASADGNADYRFEAFGELIESVVISGAGPVRHVRDVEIAKLARQRAGAKLDRNKNIALEADLHLAPDPFGVCSGGRPADNKRAGSAGHLLYAIWPDFSCGERRVVPNTEFQVAE